MKKSSLIFIILMLFNSGFAQAALKNSEFMKLDKEKRHWWYAGAYTNLGHVAAMDDDAKAQCVWKWFFDDPNGRTAQLEKSFVKYPNHSPTTVVLALLRRDCGAFKRAD